MSMTSGVLHHPFRPIGPHCRTFFITTAQGQGIWSHELPLKYHFFTDGSSIRDPTQQGKRLGASAIVLIVQTGQGLRWGGSRTFQVDDGPTAPKTEIVAIVLALLWCIQIGDAHPHSLTPFQVSFGYDCQAAGHVAAGQWRIKAHHALQTHGRALALWVQHRFNVHIEWEHIRSHTGHPWNEAADALSWAAVHNWITAPSAADILQQLDIPDPSLSSWLWMIEASRQQAPGLPTISDRHFLVNVASPLAQKASSDNQPFLRRQMQESPQQARTTVSVEVKFATANVLTLYDSNRNAHGYFRKTGSAHGADVSGRASFHWRTGNALQMRRLSLDRKVSCTCSICYQKRQWRSTAMGQQDFRISASPNAH